MKRRFSRAAYWTLGGAIALTGAVAARILGDHVGDVFRVPVWLTGAALIFVGLGVVSLGTKARLEDRGDGQDDDRGEDDGAGEG